MAFSLTGTRKSRHRRQISSEINVTPLVDVMLVLLIIFMVCSPMLVAGVQVDLPKTKAAALAGQDEPIAISIDKSGSIYIQESKVKIQDLAAKLEAVLKEKKETRIFVRGDRKIDYGKVMEVFGAIKVAGYKNVALVTEGLDQN
jgi:biopolymer transport protein TolR